MKLRSKFVLFIVLIHAVIIILSLLLLENHKVYFFIAEFLILISIGISIRLYQEFIRPLNLISNGIESMKDKDFSIQFKKVGQRELDQLIELYNQMIAKLREERITQQEQHYFLSRLIEALPTGLIILDFDGKISSINPAAEALLGLNADQILGKNLPEINTGIAVYLGKLNNSETKIININGIESYKCQKSHFVDRGFHHHFILIEELTEQIHKTEKKAYEKVIRMMSHEINNSIGAVNSILNTILKFTSQQNIIDKDYNDAIQIAIERNEKLNSFMSKFADVVRIPAPVKEKYDLHKLLGNVSLLVSAELNERNIDVLWNLTDGPFNIKIDVQQLEQVLLNILKNAAEAISHNGKIVIKTEDNYLSIIDNGKGISRELQQKIFTPFFSSKKDGQGIGLTVTREILLNHNFKYSLLSNTDGRTEFRILFSK
jgi:two-component system nitrogen regulation sensor histidine kinase NtrY